MTAYGEGLRPVSPYGEDSVCSTPQPSPAPSCPNTDPPDWLWPGYHCTQDKELRRVYGITCEDYWQLSVLQGGVCAICQQRPGKMRLVVDHDPDTDEVCGLIHSRHNRVISRQIRRYVKSPPALQSGLKVDPARLREMDKRRQKRRQTYAKNHGTKEDQRTNGPTSNLDRLRAMTQGGN